MLPPRYDEFGVPLCRSGVSERIWAFYPDKPEDFKREVREYFALGYPGWTVKAASFQERIIWLQDDRRRTI
jgi:hypothetical protein